MHPRETCAFCDTSDLEWRTIRSDPVITSFVSKPWMRYGHCLVVPNRHVTTLHELDEREAAALIKELGRLSLRLDNGFGTGIMQKYQPLQAENGIKVSHLHVHVLPRHETEPGLFPVPEPNSFDGFIIPTDEEIAALVQKLK